MIARGAYLAVFVSKFLVVRNFFHVPFKAINFSLLLVDFLNSQNNRIKDKYSLNLLIWFYRLSVLSVILSLFEFLVCLVETALPSEVLTDFVFQLHYGGNCNHNLKKTVLSFVYILSHLQGFSVD